MPFAYRENRENCEKNREKKKRRFRKKVVKTLGVAVTDFRPEKLKNESLFSPLWLWRKFFLCLLNARANRFSKKLVKRLGVAALLSGVRRYDVVAVFSKARMIVWP